MVSGLEVCLRLVLCLATLKSVVLSPRNHDCSYTGVLIAEVRLVLAISSVLDAVYGGQYDWLRSSGGLHSGEQDGQNHISNWATML